MNIDFAVVFPYWHILLKGLGLTIAITLSCALIGSLAGFVLSLLRGVRNPLIRLPITLYVEFFAAHPC